MSKITRKCFLILLLLFGSLGFGTMVGFADPKAGNKSEAEISYTENKDITVPHHPTKPKEIVEIISPRPVNPGTAGPLSVDVAPNVIFGNQDASSKDDIYYARLTQVKQVADGTIKEVPNFIQITDNRGKNAGWRLTVKQNGQLSNGTHYLDGAEISLRNISLNSPDNGTKPVVANDVRLDPLTQEAAEISRSDEKSGKGTWLIIFGSDEKESKQSIQVNVPGKSEKKKGNYTTSLTWELIDSPI